MFLFHIFIHAVLIMTVGATSSVNILCSIFAVVVFQLVPVIPTMKKSLDGLPLIAFAICPLIFFHHW